MVAELLLPVLLPIALTFGLVSPVKPSSRSFEIVSGSIAPTLVTGDRVIACIGDQVASGDVIVFVSPRDSKTNLSKRVIGLPGDHVRLVRGVVWINHQAASVAFESDYTFIEKDMHLTLNGALFRETLPSGQSHEIFLSTLSGAEDTPEFVVPPDEFFVLGDNRDNSLDSRFQKEFGFVPVRNVIGRMSWIYWSGNLLRLFHLIR